MRGPRYLPDRSAELLRAKAGSAPDDARLRLGGGRAKRRGCWMAGSDGARFEDRLPPPPPSTGHPGWRESFASLCERPVTVVSLTCRAASLRARAAGVRARWAAASVARRCSWLCDIRAVRASASVVDSRELAPTAVSVEEGATVQLRWRPDAHERRQPGAATCDKREADTDDGRGRRRSMGVGAPRAREPAGELVLAEGSALEHRARAASRPRPHRIDSASRGWTTARAAERFCAAAERARRRVATRCSDIRKRRLRQRTPRSMPRSERRQQLGLSSDR